MRTFRFDDDVHPRGDGPWQDEPDKAQWVHDETQLDCLAVRNPLLGSWCGYVGVPVGHPWFGLGPRDIHAHVHGGVTFTGPDRGGPAHMPEPGRPERVWWVGFACAHGGDFPPTLAAALGDLGVRRPLEGLEYRTLAYTTDQVEVLAAQAGIAAAAALSDRAGPHPGLGPELLDLVLQMEAAQPSYNTPEFTRLQENLLRAQVCTSLDDAAATVRMNAAPTGTSGGWVLSDDEDHAPVACDEKPLTHRHLVFGL